MSACSKIGSTGLIGGGGAEGNDEESGLTYLSDLPSAGDTSYTGVVIRGDDLYVSYYTSDIDKDFPWIMGMLASSDIRIARIALPSLEALAHGRSQ